MVQKKTGLSIDYIIHPGETVAEILKDRNMTQKELAERTGSSTKHICKVVSGKANISPSFAKKLEYALDIPSGFWINLQAIYDNEYQTYIDENEISDKELIIVKKLDKIVEYLCQLNMINKNLTLAAVCVALRRLFGLSSLTIIPQQSIVTAFRKSEATSTDIFILFAWLRLCELLDAETPSQPLDVKKLESYIPEIKSLINEDISYAQKRLKEIFFDCGIVFKIVKHFVGAPVQGFIKKAKNGTILLCMTIRYSFRDIFWFTLFHEIAHVLHGDYNDDSKIDFVSNNDNAENLADMYARDAFVNPADYARFISNRHFYLNNMEQFAKSQIIPVDILVGRLQHDGFLEISAYNNLKVKYSWDI
jgi:HTH-type transcriptional regulator/antitoxin HigA